MPSAWCKRFGNKGQKAVTYDPEEPRPILMFVSVIKVIIIRRFLSYRNQRIDLLWTEFYMIGTSVMKELTCAHKNNFSTFTGAPLVLASKDIHLKLWCFFYFYRLHWQVFKLATIHSFKPTNIRCIFNPLYYPQLVLLVRESAHWHVNFATSEFDPFFVVINKIL